MTDLNTTNGGATVDAGGNVDFAGTSTINGTLDFVPVAPITNTAGRRCLRPCRRPSMRR
ncbi:MAG: hypothetical protein U5O39_18940 [Gammaproteobacteria bacterium]|nr:hypothetical protein [Gammaproteobacteria bacterium]